ncbi:hypothetical protein CD129_13035, partial [Mammaliicoccus fleurettii]
MKRVAYSVETKNKVIEMKIKGCSIREIMDQLNIRSKTQVDMICSLLSKHLNSENLAGSFIMTRNIKIDI